MVSDGFLIFPETNGKHRLISSRIWFWFSGFEVLVAILNTELGMFSPTEHTRLP